MKLHKCAGCKYKSEYHKMGFASMGVCNRKKNLVEAMMAYNADKCPYKKTNFDKITESTESLASHLVESIDMDLVGLRYKASDGKLCKTWGEAIQRTIDWLQQEVDNG